jgi:anti-sigma regulatory factor (Ser/Thr protein kinase)
VPRQALQARPVSIADARKVVRDQLDGFLSPHKLAEAELLTSELVTNAVRHAQLKERDRIGLDIDVDADTVCVAVVDGGPGFDFGKIIFWEPGDRRGGWGLYIVDKLSYRWGIDGSPSHSVWFEIDR